MNAYTKLPALLRRIDALESGAALCRRPGCHEVAFTWLSPYCRPLCKPQSDAPSAGAVAAPLLFDAGSFAANSYSMRLAMRYSAGLAPPNPRSLVIITAC